MKNRLRKLIAFSLMLGMLTAICNGCGANAAKSEPIQSAVQPTSETIQDFQSGSNPAEKDSTEMTEAADTPAQKAMQKYAQLLQSYPAIVQENAEILNDLSFGYEDNLLQFGKHYDFFAVWDFDNDGIPELIASTIINNQWVPVSVFRYQESENEPQLLKDPFDPESHATFEHMSTAGGTYSFYICKENHLHSCWGGDTPLGFQEENHGYVLTPEGLAAVDCGLSIHTGDASDIVVNFREILKVNDEEARKTAFAW